MTKEETIKRIVGHCASIGADVNDADGRIRAITGPNFYLWFCVCCDLADVYAKREGYDNSVDRAWKMAKAKMATV